MKKKILIGVLVAILATGLVSAVVYYHLGFRQSADVSPVAIITVYQNEALTDELQQGEMLNWGAVSSGTQTMPLWIKNTGGVNTLIGFNYRQDQFPGDWTLSWDYDGTALVPGEVRQVTLTLELPVDIHTGHWEWDSDISAWEAPP